MILRLTLFFTLFFSKPIFAQDFLSVSTPPLEKSLTFAISISTLIIALPALLICCTCFPFLVIVFSICRQALGLQQSPPNIILIAVSLSLTYLVMAGSFESSWIGGISPFLEGTIGFQDFVEFSTRPFLDFMRDNVSEENVTLVSSYVNETKFDLESDDIGSIKVLAPTFILEQVTRAFVAGFFIVLPFLIIDLVTAAILMSMGMMMVPPSVVSLPFKIGFFSMANGWFILAMSSISYYK